MALPANIVGLPSPGKAVGSFLHKAVSPSIKKSPLNPASRGRQDKSPAARGDTPGRGAAKRKLNVEDMKSQVG